MYCYLRVQIIGHVLRRDLESACNERSKREIAKIYITSEIMAEAIKKQKDTLEEVSIGIVNWKCISLLI